QKDFIEVLYLRKKYQENHWQAGINKALNCGAYDPAAIESIIKMLLAPDGKCNEIATQERFTSRNLNVPKWECKLTGYGTLSKEAVSKEISHPNDKVVPIFHNVEFSKHGNAMQGKWNGTIADNNIVLRRLFMLEKTLALLNMKGSINALESISKIKDKIEFVKALLQAECD